MSRCAMWLAKISSGYVLYYNEYPTLDSIINQQQDNSYGHGVHKPPFHWEAGGQKEISKFITNQVPRSGLPQLTKLSSRH